MARIFLSPSSQEANLGIIKGYIEEVECNRIARACGALLEKSGHVVGYNSPGEDYKGHVTRAKAFNADIILCIHTNASSDPNVSGLHAGCYDPTDMSRESTKLTKAIYDVLAPVTPSLKDKMTQYRFYEVVENVPPVAYIELSFHTNRIDCEWLIANTNLIGQKLAEGASAYLKTPLVVEVEQPAPDWEGTIKDKDDQIVELTKRIASLQGNLSTVRGELVASQGLAAKYLKDLQTLAVAEDTRINILGQY